MKMVTALVCRLLLPNEPTGGPAACGERILATVSQEMTVELGGGLNDTALTRMVRLAERITGRREVKRAAGQA